MNALGYCRISTKDQSHFSLDYQERHVKSYCGSNNLNLVEIFTDDGESSYTFDRPDFKRLEACIKKNKNIQYLIIFDHDRFSRNLAEALIKIKELHDKYGVKVLATTDSIDTDYSDPSAFLIRSFKYMMAESELHRIRARVKQGIKQALLLGRYLHQAPFGYTKSKDSSGKSILLINPQQAELVRIVFKEYLNGTPNTVIKELMKERGWQINGNSGIPKIISNPVYAGLIRVPADQKTPEKIVKGMHKAIIPEPDYWLAQDKLNGGKVGKVVSGNEEVFLRGVITCAQCGRKLTAGRSKGKSKHYWYYECKDHRTLLSATKLHKQFNQIIDTLNYDDEMVSWIETTVKKVIQAMDEQKGDVLRELEANIKSLEVKIEKTEKRYLEAEEMNPETFKKVISGLRKEKAQREVEHRELKKSGGMDMKKLEKLMPTLTRVSPIFESMSLTRKHLFITTVFGKSLSHDGKIYRTPLINPLFSHNRLKLKELSLLEITHIIGSKDLTPPSGVEGNITELLEQLFNILVA